MVLEQISTLILTGWQLFVSKLDFYNLILPLTLYTIVLSIYGIFVFYFYKTVSKRDLFNRKIAKKFGTVGYMFKYLVLFPIFTFLWFGMLMALLFLLANPYSVQTILLISIAIIATIRITAYYKEELSGELAKVFPLSLLVTFISNPTSFSFETVYQRFLELPTFAASLMNYLLFIFVLEFFLRISFSIKRKVYEFKGVKIEDEEAVVSEEEK